MELAPVQDGGEVLLEDTPFFSTWRRPRQNENKNPELEENQLFHNLSQDIPPRPDRGYKLCFSG